MKIYGFSRLEKSTMKKPRTQGKLKTRIYLHTLALKLCLKNFLV